MKKIQIKEISTYLPEKIISNQEIENRINKKSSFLSSGVLNKLFGLDQRRFAASEEQVSDLAVKAALPILEKIDKSEIDLLIFAAACADLIEPATSNIVQHKLGLDCPAMDVKNACNSFLSAIHIASAFIQADTYKNVLVVNGEKLSDAINFEIRDKAHLQSSLAALSLGDAGVAALLSESPSEKGLFFQEFMTRGKYWDLCTIKGGGSMHPHDVTKNYFEGKTAEMHKVFENEVKDFVQGCIKKAGWLVEEIDHLITHQVSISTFENIASHLGIDRSKVISVFEECGNTAAASIPLALAKGIKSHFNTGDKIAVVGFAAGLSASVQLINW